MFQHGEEVRGLRLLIILMPNGGQAPPPNYLSSTRKYPIESGVRQQMLTSIRRCCFESVPELRGLHLRGSEKKSRGADICARSIRVCGPKYCCNFANAELQKDYQYFQVLVVVFR
jgi:hypothetical protein